MKRMKCILAAAIMAAAAYPSVAQEPAKAASEMFPGSVFVLPSGSETPVAADEDPEITSDIELFRNKGFLEPSWQTHTEQVDDVLREVVIPDWKKRTGETADPEMPSIDIAAEQVLENGFSDLLVMSRLPEDCDPTGCLFQLYSFVNEVWVKRFEFKTVAFAWKPGTNDETIIAQVGGMWVPSRTHIWKDGRLR